jgi:hypothetical protein
MHMSSSKRSSSQRNSASSYWFLRISCRGREATSGQQVAQQETRQQAHPRSQDTPRPRHHTGACATYAHHAFGMSTRPP